MSHISLVLLFLGGLLMFLGFGAYWRGKQGNKRSLYQRRYDTAQRHLRKQMKYNPLGTALLGLSLYAGCGLLLLAAYLVVTHQPSAFTQGMFNLAVIFFMESYVAILVVAPKPRPKKSYFAFQ